MSELKPFDDKLAGLIAGLSASRRHDMTAEIAKRLRISQQQRIKRQQAPSGTPYAARKRQPIRSKKGRVKREMFAKLRTHRYMKPKAPLMRCWSSLLDACSVSRVCTKRACVTDLVGIAKRCNMIDVLC